MSLKTKPARSCGRSLISGSLIFLVLLQSANAGLFGPSTFEDCVLENIKGVSQPQKIGVVKKMCRNKFPLKDDECENIEIKVRSNPSCKTSLRARDLWAVEAKKGTYFDLPPGLPLQCELPYGCSWKEN